MAVAWDDASVFFVESDGKRYLPTPNSSSFFLCKTSLLNHSRVYFVIVLGNEKLLYLEQVLSGNFKGDLWYHKIPLAETLLAPVRVGRVFMIGALTVDPGARPVSPVQIGLMGSSMSPLVGELGATNNLVSSKCRSTVADAALAEDISDNVIGTCSRRRRNIDSLLAKSLVVNEIFYGDIPQQT